MHGEWLLVALPRGFPIYRGKTFSKDFIHYFGMRTNCFDNNKASNTRQVQFPQWQYFDVLADCHVCTLKYNLLIGYCNDTFCHNFTGACSFI